MPRHQPAWTATQNIRNSGGVAYSVEDILRTQSFLPDGKFRGASMSSILEAKKQSDIALNFYWSASWAQDSKTAMMAIDCGLSAVSALHRLYILVRHRS